MEREKERKLVYLPLWRVKMMNRRKPFSDRYGSIVYWKEPL